MSMIDYLKGVKEIKKRNLHDKRLKSLSSLNLSEDVLKCL